MKEKKVEDYSCTICGGDATFSFQGFYDKDGKDRNGNKNPFKKEDRPCLSCLRKKTGQKLF